MAKRSALVAGGSGALGGEISVALAEAGWSVGVHYLSNRDAAERVVARCEAIQARAAALRADLANAAECEDLLDSCERAFGGAPELLVVSVGSLKEAPLLRTEESDWDSVFRSCFTAPAGILRAAAARWCAGPPVRGKALVLGSRAGEVGRAGGGAYSAAKAALTGLVRTAARELGPLGIEINVVIPPFVADGMGLAASSAFVDRAVRDSVLGRSGSAREFAAFVARMADCNGISGQLLYADSRV